MSRHCALCCTNLSGLTANNSSQTSATDILHLCCLQLWLRFPWSLSMIHLQTWWHNCNLHHWQWWRDSTPDSSCSGSRPPSADSDCSTGRWFQFSFSKLVRKCPEETSECLHNDRSAKEMIATWCHSIPLRHSSAPCSKVHPSPSATTSQHHWPTWTALWASCKKSAYHSSCRPPRATGHWTPSPAELQISDNADLWPMQSWDEADSDQILIM